MSKKTSKHNILCLIFAILSCFYTFTFVFSILLTKIAISLVPNPEVIEYNNFHFSALILIVITSVLSILFAHFSTKSGFKTKITTTGKILSIISLIIAAISTIIVIFLFY